MILNAIKQIENAAKAADDIISLGQGIPFQPSDDVIRSAAIEAISRGLADKYSEPAGLPELREAICSSLAEDGMDFGSSEVIVTAGAMEGLSASILSLVSPERNEVIVPTPVYAAYFKAVELAGGIVVEVPLREETGWELLLEDIERAISEKTAAILICNPNNPTGSVYPRSQLMRLAELASEHGCMLITDEVYGNIAFDGADIYTPARLKQYRRNIIRLVSFSKDFSLTGWRIGYLHTDRSNIPSILGTHDTLVNCAPVVSQYAAMAALRYRRRIISENQARYARNREIICKELDTMSGFLSYEKPKATYFVFPKLHGVSDSSPFVLKLLAKGRVAVIPGEAFGKAGAGHVRLCFGRSEEEIVEAMRRLKRFSASA